MLKLAQKCTAMLLAACLPLALALALVLVPLRSASCCSGCHQVHPSWIDAKQKMMKAPRKQMWSSPVGPFSAPQILFAPFFLPLSAFLSYFLAGTIMETWKPLESPRQALASSGATGQSLPLPHPLLMKIRRSAILKLVMAVETCGRQLAKKVSFSFA